jgi:CRP-like cAMP-binding protein
MAAITNHLIDIMPHNERKRLLSICERVDLRLSQVLSESATITRHVYFPTGSFLSLLTSLDDLPMLEIGMVGSEGMLGTGVALGMPQSGLHARVQGNGTAWRLTTAQFKEELGRNSGLRHSLNRYLQVTMLQLTSVARCLRFHDIDHRLARWLLMTQDRAHQDSFDVTQESIAFMLGVRRVSVTKAAAELQRRGVIAYSRGVVTVIDRKVLEAAACSCYAADLLCYSKYL